MADASGKAPLKDCPHPWQKPPPPRLEPWEESWFYTAHRCSRRFSADEGAGHVPAH